jgi:hypothetical protein
VLARDIRNTKQRLKVQPLVPAALKGGGGPGLADPSATKGAGDPGLADPSATQPLGGLGQGSVAGPAAKQAALQQQQQHPTYHVILEGIDVSYKIDSSSDGGGVVTVVDAHPMAQVTAP